MKCKKIFPLLILAGGFRFLNAQDPLWITSLNYESSPLAAPVIIALFPSDDKNLTFGIFGWTIHADRTETLSPSESFSLSADITPLHSHSSNIVYKNGKEDPTLEYHNMTMLLKGGFSFKDPQGWKTDLYTIFLYEKIGGLSDKTTTNFWKFPFGGFEIQESYSNIISDEILRSRIDGIRCNANLQIYTGSATWWRGDVSIHLGQKLGPIFFRENSSYLLGNSLNLVSKFLVGGSWDILGNAVLYGHPYAEFRLNNAVLVNVGTDISIMDLGVITIRSGYVTSPAKTGFGEGVGVEKTWDGMIFNLGISFSENPQWKRETIGPVVLAGITAAFFQ